MISGSRAAGAKMRGSVISWTGKHLRKLVLQDTSDPIINLIVNGFTFLHVATKHLFRFTFLPLSCHSAVLMLRLGCEGSITAWLIVWFLSLTCATYKLGHICGRTVSR